jgi:hypothetical protein
LAAGVPVITTLRTHGPSGDGLVVLDTTPDLGDQLIAEVRGLLADADLWRRHSRGAVARASRWGVDDVARTLRHWVSTSHRHRPGTVTTVADLGVVR